MEEYVIKHTISQVKSDPVNIAEIFANQICSNSKQSVLCLIIGKTGSGKSYASLDIAFNTSLLVAHKLGKGNPEDYFNIKENVAIIKGEEVLRIAKNIKERNIYILDDCGTNEGISARKWQSEQNNILMSIFQTIRVRQCCFILTVPDSDFIDKQARQLLHFRIVMKSRHFGEGYTLGKFSTVNRNHNKESSGSYFPFLRSKGRVANLAVFRLPPRQIIKEYDIRRLAIEEELRLKSVQRLEEDLEMAEKKRAKDLDRVRSVITPSNWKQVVRELKAKNPEMTYKDLERAVGKSRASVGRALSGK